MADVNRDGWPDLVSTNSGLASLSVLLNTGDELPTATAQAVTGYEDTPLTLTLTGTLTSAFRITGLPTHGVLYAGADTSGTVIAGASAAAPYLLFGNQVTYVPDGDYAGPDNFMFRAANRYALGSSAAVSLTVEALNDVPSFAAGANQRVGVSAGAQTVAGWATALSSGPANEAGQTLTFLISGNSNPSLFSSGPAVSGSTGNLTFTPAPGASGVARLWVRVKDNGGTANGGVDTSPLQVFEITVSDENEVPGTPTWTSPSSTVANLTWADNGGSETGFRVERQGPGDSGFTAVGEVGANVTTFQDTALTPGAEYRYRVRYLVGSAASEPSGEAVVRTLAKPTDLETVTLSGEELVLLWQDHVSGEAGFEIERKLSGGGFLPVGTAAANWEAFLDEGLTPGSTYSYRVRAYNAHGYSDWSATVSGATFGTVPTAPSGLTAIQAGANEVRLGWTDQSADETGFELRRKTGTAGAAGDYARVALLPTGTTTYLDSGRTPGATYTYQVVAVNAAGASTPAGPTSATLTVDTVKPIITLTGTRSGPPVQIEITAQDTGSGLASIEVITADNCTISVAAFTPGTTAPVLVTATKTNPAITARVAIRARDLAGNVLDGDPVITELVIPKKATKVVKSFPGLPAVESWLTVENDTPGLKKLVVTVNQTKPLTLTLKNGQRREQDLASRIQPGDGNTIKLVGHGKPGARALVIIAEPPVAGSAARLRVQRVSPQSGPPVSLEWHR